MGLLDFDGERIVLTREGELLRRDRRREDLLALPRENILGIDELIALLEKRPATEKEVTGHLVDALGLSWKTDAQSRYRLQWLAACGAVEKREKSWRLVR